MNKRAVIYTRVSTDLQAEKGYSLISQLEACRKYAKDNDYEIVAEFSDDYSGRELDRPGLNDLRQMISKSKIDALIVYSGDRLTRDLAHSIELRREFSIFQVELCKVLGGQVDDSPQGRFTENITSAVSQLESEIIVERSQRGKNQRAKEGKIIHQGYPPYGYDRVGRGSDAYYVINEFEANVVRNIFEWYTVGNGNGGPMSLRSIASHLNDISIHPPNKCAKSGTYWHPMTVRKILKNEIYVGRTYYGKSRIVNKKRVYIPREKWISIDVPELAFIDRSSFEAAEKRFVRNKQLSKRNRKGEYLMVGFIRCGHCGGTVCGHTRHYKSGKDVKYYRCGNHWAQFVGKEKCGIKHIDTVQYKIDIAVWDWIKNLLCDPVALEAGLNEMMEQRRLDIEPKHTRLESLDSLIKETEAKIRKLIKEMVNHHDDIVMKAFRQEVGEVSKCRDALIEEREKLGIELSETEITEGKKDLILAMAEEIARGLDDANFENKRRVMDILDVRAVLHYDEKGKWIGISCAIPAYNDVIELHPSARRLQDLDRYGRPCPGHAFSRHKRRSTGDCLDRVGATQP